MKMNYFVFGTNDKSKAVAFYSRLFEDCGIAKIHDEGRMTLWANEDFMFAVAEPFDGKEASNGNGTMVGLQVASSEEVDRLHEKGIALGGTCEGEPTVRSGMYSAYIRDLDRNKLCLYTR